MFGKKKQKTPSEMAKIKSVKKLEKVKSNNYLMQVKACIDNYNNLIESLQSSPNTAKHFINQKESFIRAVKSSDEYKNNQKKFDTIISAAGKSKPIATKTATCKRTTKPKSSKSTNRTAKQSSAAKAKSKK